VSHPDRCAKDAKNIRVIIAFPTHHRKGTGKGQEKRAIVTYQDQQLIEHASEG